MFKISEIVCNFYKMSNDEDKWFCNCGRSFDLVESLRGTNIFQTIFKLNKLTLPHLTEYCALKVRERAQFYGNLLNKIS